MSPIRSGSLVKRTGCIYQWKNSGILQLSTPVYLSLRCNQRPKKSTIAGHIIGGFDASTRQLSRRNLVA